jgi:hypothetical protein
MSELEKYMHAAAAVWNVSKNFGAEIVNDLNSVKSMLRERLPLNCISIKFKDFLAEKLWEGFHLIKL